METSATYKTSNDYSRECDVTLQWLFSLVPLRRNRLYELPNCTDAPLHSNRDPASIALAPPHCVGNP